MGPLAVHSRPTPSLQEILSIHVEEGLRYFAGNASPGGFFTPSKAARDREYDEDELRALVVAAIPCLRSLAVSAQRFYSAASTRDAGGAGTNQRENTSVLTFGKDIQMTTKTVPHVTLEGKLVDQLHVRSELQQRSARLRTAEHAQMRPTVLRNSQTPQKRSGSGGRQH
ncbi:hypothetical protein BBJ28_00003249 [Nothophytophthora sp. Chile5]|nr:hypothetical protein BBJ28_00003249 [Nothophytophthora sp. Chile5]